MKKNFLVLGLGLAMLSSSTFAHNLQIDQLLPAVKVSDYGEIVLNGKDIVFQSWTSSTLPGKVRIVHQKRKIKQ